MSFIQFRHSTRKRMRTKLIEHLLISQNIEDIVLCIRAMAKHPNKELIFVGLNQQGLWYDTPDCSTHIVMRQTIEEMKKMMNDDRN